MMRMTPRVHRVMKTSRTSTASSPRVSKRRCHSGSRTHSRISISSGRNSGKRLIDVSAVSKRTSIVSISRSRVQLKVASSLMGTGIRVSSRLATILRKNFIRSNTKCLSCNRNYKLAMNELMLVILIFNKISININSLCIREFSLI
jgi:hypothetical protein